MQLASDDQHLIMQVNVIFPRSSHDSFILKQSSLPGLSEGEGRLPEWLLRDWIQNTLRIFHWSHCCSEICFHTNIQKYTILFYRKKPKTSFNKQAFQHQPSLFLLFAMRDCAASINFLTICRSYCCANVPPNTSLRWELVSPSYPIKLISQLPLG